MPPRRIYDPDVANEYLMGIINEETQVREFDFRMKHDETWEFAKYYLSQWEAEPGAAAADSGGM